MVLRILLILSVCSTWAYKGHKVCVTPDGKGGMCVETHSCAPILQLLQKKPIPAGDLQFLRQSRCSGPYAYGVCCEIQKGFTKKDPLAQGFPASAPAPALPGPSLPGPSRCTADIGFRDSNSGCCGKATSTYNGFGSDTAELGQFPWLALIEYRKNHQFRVLCGGALISSQYVLTAGHCVDGHVLTYGTPENVILGEHDTSASHDCAGRVCADPVVSIPIELIVSHPDYDVNKRRDDIALIRMRQSTPYTNYVKPICLPSSDSSLVLTIAGWASTNDTVSNPGGTKKYTAVPFVDPRSCQQFYNVTRRRIPLWEKQMCAGGAPKSCIADSGGPLMAIVGDKYEIVGVMNFGPTPCGWDGTPEVYTKVSEYNSWIRNEVNLRY